MKIENEILIAKAWDVLREWVESYPDIPISSIEIKTTMRLALVYVNGKLIAGV